MVYSFFFFFSHIIFARKCRTTHNYKKLLFSKGKVLFHREMKNNSYIGVGTQYKEKTMDKFLEFFFRLFYLLQLKYRNLRKFAFNKGSGKSFLKMRF